MNCDKHGMLKIINQNQKTSYEDFIRGFYKLIS